MAEKDMTESEFTEAWCAVCVHLSFCLEGCCFDCPWWTAGQTNEGDLGYPIWAYNDCLMFHPDPLRFRTRGCSAREPREAIARRLWSKVFRLGYGKDYWLNQLVLGKSIRHKAATTYYGRQT